MWSKTEHVVELVLKGGVERVWASLRDLCCFCQVHQKDEGEKEGPDRRKELPQESSGGCSPQNSVPNLVERGELSVNAAVGVLGKGKPLQTRSEQDRGSATVLSHPLVWPVHRGMGMDVDDKPMSHGERRRILRNSHRAGSRSQIYGEVIKGCELTEGSIRLHIREIGTSILLLPGTGLNDARLVVIVITTVAAFLLLITRGTVGAVVGVISIIEMGILGQAFDRNVGGAKGKRAVSNIFKLRLGLAVGWELRAKTRG